MMKIQGSTPLAQKNVAFESVASAPHTGAFLTHCWQRPNDEFLGMRDANGNTRLLSGTNLVGATARIGSFLENFLEPQQRILIAIDDGLDFSQAFLGCLHANVTAVVTATSNFTYSLRMPPLRPFSLTKARGGSSTPPGSLTGSTSWSSTMP